MKQFTNGQFTNGQRVRVCFFDNPPGMARILITYFGVYLGRARPSCGRIKIGERIAIYNLSCVFPDYDSDPNHTKHGL